MVLADVKEGEVGKAAGAAEAAEEGVDLEIQQRQQPQKQPSAKKNCSDISIN